MSKIYLVGIGKNIDLNRLEEIIIAANMPVNAEVICVSSVEEIPIEERSNSSLVIESVHKLTLCERIPDLICLEKPDEKIKGWQRPYKFHR